MSSRDLILKQIYNIDSDEQICGMFKKSVLNLMSSPLKRKDSFFNLKFKLQETAGEN